MITEKTEFNNSESEYGEDKIEELRQKLKELRDEARREEESREKSMSYPSELAKLTRIENFSDKHIHEIPKKILELWDKLKKAEIMNDEDLNTWIDRIDNVLEENESPVSMREIFSNIIAEKELNLLKWKRINKQ